jgi:DNA-binding Lrp family transcriptional regulator
MVVKLKGQDVLLVLKLLSDGGRKDSFAGLARSLGISGSEAHAALGRARNAGLVHALEDRVDTSAVREFLLHAVKYAFPVRPGGRTRGMVTGFAAAPLDQHFRQGGEDSMFLVWPDPEGTASGLEIEPFCPSVPRAARGDSVLYEWLVLADALRGAGRAREREFAAEEVEKRLKR